MNAVFGVVSLASCLLYHFGSQSLPAFVGSMPNDLTQMLPWLVFYTDLKFGLTYIRTCLDIDA